MKKLLSLFVAVAILGLVGCGEQNYGGDVKAVSSAEDEIKKIEANEKMPPMAKKAAIDAIKAREASSSQQAEAVKK